MRIRVSSFKWNEIEWLTWFRIEEKKYKLSWLAMIVYHEIHETDETDDFRNENIQENGMTVMNVYGMPI